MNKVIGARDNILSIEEVLARLAGAEQVDGLALFGSRLHADHNPVSDYDLLIVVDGPPVRIFQMLTHIDGRMADVVFMETDLVDDLLALDFGEAVSKRQRYMMQKLPKAEIVYDPSDRLARARQYTLDRVEAVGWPVPATPSEQYAMWFWQNHGLIHVKRLGQSADSVYQTAADMMLLNGLAAICKGYFQARHLTWQGEKKAIHHLMAADPEFLAQFRACLAEPDRGRKITLFESLVEHALAPVGPLWQPGSTSVFLADAAQQPERVDEALAYWETLLGEG